MKTCTICTMRSKTHYGIIAEEAPTRLQTSDTFNGKTITNLDFYSQWAYSFAGIKVLDSELSKLKEITSSQQQQIDELKKEIEELKTKNTNN